MRSKLTQAYLEIANRSIQAATVTQRDQLYEKACFLAYHAFESAGGAMASSYRRPYPLGHIRKLNAFTILARSRTYGLAVAALASALASIRKRALYPHVKPGGIVETPRQAVTSTASRRILRRVAGVVAAIEKDL